MAESTRPAGSPQNRPAAEKPAGAGAQQKAPAGAPNQAAMLNRARQMTPPGKRQKKKTSGALIVGLLLTVLFAAAVGMVYFDIAGFKEAAVTALHLSDPTKTQLEALDAREQTFTQREDAIAAEEDAQKATAKDLKAREKAVAEKETALAEQEAAQAQRQDELDDLASTLDAKKIELSNAVAMFSSMDSVKAAKALSGIKNPADIALLLLYMDSEKSAEILNNMQASLATKVMSEIIKMQLSTAVPTATPQPTPQSSPNPTTTP